MVAEVLLKWYPCGPAVQQPQDQVSPWVLWLLPLVPWVKDTSHPGSWACKVQIERQIEMQIELWVGAQTKRTASLWDNKGHQDRWQLAIKVDTERHFRSQELLTFWITKEMKTGKDFLVEGPPLAGQLWQFLCHCMELDIWDSAMGKPGAELVRKPGLSCVSGVWSESNRAPVSTLELTSLKGLWSQQSQSLWSWECDWQRVSEWMVWLGIVSLIHEPCCKNLHLHLSIPRLGFALSKKRYANSCTITLKVMEYLNSSRTKYSKTWIYQNVQYSENLHSSPFCKCVLTEALITSSTTIFF